MTKGERPIRGLDLARGTLMPLFVIVFNAVWGLTATAILVRTEDT